MGKNLSNLFVYGLWVATILFGIWVFLPFSAQEKFKDLALGKYRDFEKECAGEIKYCQKVPLCFKDDYVSVPDASYGEIYELGSFGGYFWGGDKEKDIENIKKNAEKAMEEMQMKRKGYYEKINICLKDFSTP